MRGRRSELRWWFSGRILVCRAGARGSIPRQRKTMFLKKYYSDGMLMQLQMCWTVFTIEIIDIEWVLGHESCLHFFFASALLNPPC